MNVLVFDANVDFARRAVNFIESNIRGARADLASNVFILRRRLKNSQWDFVLADIAATASMQDVLTELQSLQCPVILWSTLRPAAECCQVAEVPGRTRAEDHRSVLTKFRILDKPKTITELSNAVHNLVETA